MFVDASRALNWTEVWGLAGRILAGLSCLLDYDSARWSASGRAADCRLAAVDSCPPMVELWEMKAFVGIVDII